VADNIDEPAKVERENAGEVADKNEGSVDAIDDNAAEEVEEVRAGEEEEPPVVDVEANDDLNAEVNPPNDGKPNPLPTLLVAPPDEPVVDDVLLPNPAHGDVAIADEPTPANREVAPLPNPPNKLLTVALLPVEEPSTGVPLLKLARLPELVVRPDAASI
jgi:hypothetical protein